MKILLTGASGLIGKSLTKFLTAHEVIDIRKIQSKHNSSLLDFAKEWSINDLPTKID
jgi:NAD dependent epimerase/dehydratase family enzyme